ncbi:MAG: hypothetical protein ACKVK6_14740, partial [bacterium]
MSAAETTRSSMPPGRSRKGDQPKMLPANPVHTISLFVHDRPGVLVRVALVFARRGYN